MNELDSILVSRCSMQSYLLPTHSWIKQRKSFVALVSQPGTLIFASTVPHYVEWYKEKLTTFGGYKEKPIRWVVQREAHYVKWYKEKPTTLGGYKEKPTTLGGTKRSQQFLRGTKRSPLRRLVQ